MKDEPRMTFVYSGI